MWQGLRKLTPLILKTTFWDGGYYNNSHRRKVLKIVCEVSYPGTASKWQSRDLNSEI